MKNFSHMVKTLLLGTTLLAGGASVVFAQDLFRKQMEPVAIAASEFIGMRVYAAEQPVEAEEYQGVQQDWNDIGEINDVILTRDGKVDAVLVDIGGFLGMGERKVALGMENVRFVSDSATGDDPNDYFLVINADRAMLESAPDYMRVDDSAMNGDGGATMNTDTAIATEQAQTDGTVQPAQTDGTAQTAQTDGTAQPAQTDGTATGTTQMAEGTLPEGLAPVDIGSMTAEQLVGVRVYGPNEEDVGEISQVLTDANGAGEQVIVDVGGFLGIGEKPVSLDLSKMTFATGANDGLIRAYVPMTEDQLEALPKAEL